MIEYLRLEGTLWLLVPPRKDPVVHYVRCLSSCSESLQVETALVKAVAGRSNSRVGMLPSTSSRSDLHFHLVVDLHTHPSRRDGQDRFRLVIVS